MKLRKHFENGTSKAILLIDPTEYFMEQISSDDQELLSDTYKNLFENMKGTVPIIAVKTSQGDEYIPIVKEFADKTIQVHPENSAKIFKNSALKNLIKDNFIDSIVIGGLYSTGSVLSAIENASELELTTMTSYDLSAPKLDVVFNEDVLRTSADFYFDDVKPIIDYLNLK